MVRFCYTIKILSVYAAKVGWMEATLFSNSAHNMVYYYTKYILWKIYIPKFLNFAKFETFKNLT